jgi:hypothetical protein
MKQIFTKCAQQVAATVAAFDYLTTSASWSVSTYAVCTDSDECVPKDWALQRQESGGGEISDIMDEMMEEFLSENSTIDINLSDFGLVYGDGGWFEVGDDGSAKRVEFDKIYKFKAESGDFCVAADDMEDAVEMANSHCGSAKFEKIVD